MKKFFKKLISSAIALSMTFGMSTVAFAADPDITPETIDVDKTGSITVQKYSNPKGLEFVGFEEGVNGLSTDTIPDKSYPISGVQFKYLKIADIGQYLGTKTTDNKTQGEIGTYYVLNASFLSECSTRGVTITPDKTGVDGTKYYSAKTIEEAVLSLNTDQTKVEQYVNTNGTAFANTDVNGITKATNLSLGLYLIAETDTKNAAIANSWLTGDDTYIKQEGLNSQNTDYTKVDQAGTDDNIYDDGNIFDSVDKTKVSIASKSVPYLVSIPTTNTATIGTHAPGTVWMYDVYTKPKNSFTSITKMIVDQDDNKTLRMYEDYEIGDTVNYVIFADVEPLIDGKKHEKFIIDDNMTDGLTFNTIKSVKYGLRSVNPSTTDDFKTYTEFASTDYTVTKTEHTFKITFTAAGLAKLDAIEDDYLVVVSFDCILNEAAKIGTDPQNMNRSDLTWQNSHEAEYKISSNKVFAFTYQTDITKEGITKPEEVSFRIQRYNKVTGELINGDVECIKDSDGMYHIYDNAHDKTNNATKVTQLVLGQDLKLHVRGLDSEKYMIVEMTTEQGKNLLKHSFDIDLTAPDKLEGSLANPNAETQLNHRNGTVTAVAITKDGDSTAHLETKQIPLYTEAGIVYITIINNDVVSLKTGGSGTTMYYIISALMLLGCAAAVVYTKRKKA